MNCRLWKLVDGSQHLGYWVRTIYDFAYLLYESLLIPLGTYNVPYDIAHLFYESLSIPTKGICSIVVNESVIDILES